MDEQIKSEVIKVAIDAKSLAYCAYSKFRVGCAILGDNNKIYSGCSVDNCSYPCTTCAEVTATVKAVSDRCLKFKLVAVASDKNCSVWPCGRCRQVLLEFKTNGMEVIAVNGLNQTEVRTLDELMPYVFDQTTLSSSG